MNAKEWIPKHRFLFCLILFVLGIGLSILQAVLLKSPVKNHISMGLFYGAFLIVTELAIGGEGIDGHS